MKVLFPLSLIYTVYFKSELWNHANSLNSVSVEEVRQLSCCSLAFSSCYSKVDHGPMFASSFIESAGRDRKLLRASSFTALNLLFSRCTTRNFLNVDQTVWAQHTGSIFSKLWKVLRATGQRGMAITVLTLRSCWRRPRFVRRSATQRILARF